MKAGWEKKKLGEVAEYVNGYAFKPTDWEESGLKIIRIQNLNNPDAIYNYCSKELPSKYKVHNGDLLISWSASLGVYFWNSDDAYLNQHIFKVVFGKSDILKNYLKLAVEAKLHEMSKNVHGATMKHIVKSDFDNTVIPVPPIDEQVAIVAELDSLSSIIAKHKQLAEEYDRLEQSIFHDMFGDPVTNEKGWEVRIWNDVMKILNGKNQKAVEDEKGTYPIYGSGGIMGYANDYICPENTIIIGRKGNIDRPIFVKCKFWNVDTAFGLVSNTELLNPLYLFFFCKCFNFQKLNKAVTIPSLTKSDLLLIEIPLPPLSLQTLFAEKIQHIEAMKAANAKAQKEAETLFAERMNYYFGE